MDFLGFYQAVLWNLGPVRVNDQGLDLFREVRVPAGQCSRRCSAAS